MSAQTDGIFLADAASVRIYWGYKLPAVDQAAFLKDLGETFMPGTPAVLGPLGLNAYIPAALPRDAASDIPDEVALIVYPSLAVYDQSRRGNLLGRIYTFSHAAVFDVTRSRGQWPGTPQAPTASATADRWAWRIFDARLDWQTGTSRLLALASTTKSMVQYLMEFSFNKSRLAAAGIDEVVIQCTDKFATIWLHSAEAAPPLSPSALGLVGADITVLHDLIAAPFDPQQGELHLSGPQAVSFVFPRVRKFYP
jgi:hypothetical protein